jgi:hypothetical protein
MIASEGFEKTGDAVAQAMSLIGRNYSSQL